MPKLRATPQQQREKAIMKALARSQIDLALPYDKDVASHIGIERRCCCSRKQKKFQSTSLEDFAAMARKLRFTGQKVCEIIGIPYAAVPEGR